MNKAWGHFKTITRHRHLVMKHCFQVGLYRNGLLHDLSKYTPSEFRIGAKYYQGTRSPNAVEREKCGYSTAWMHHKGRNKHHFEYWTDLLPGTTTYGPVPMPTKYFVEMVMDRIAACKVYRGADYTDGAALEYLQSAKDSTQLHPQTLSQLTFVLTMLRDKGEAETFAFLRNVVLKEVPFDQWK